MTPCELTVRGRLSQPFLDLLRSRFDDVESIRRGRYTLLVVDGIDAAAERALITLLWDTGHDVVAFRCAR